ncbi:MAG: RNA polymerase sigma factor [Oscillibacter sp.]|nr:RNA polymerase sigma factor [Oscillibacter sp.]
MAIDVEEQYDKIYRYCYFKLQDRSAAEDATQETFLRYFEHYPFLTSAAALKCLYTIARNLCVDEYRKAKPLPLEPSMEDGGQEESLLRDLTVRAALRKLSREEQELLLLRYVNEVPVSAIGKLLGVSRFSVRRRLLSAADKFRKELEDLYE